MSDPYLDMPRRSLTEIARDLDARIAALKAERATIAQRRTEIRGYPAPEYDTLGERMDAISDALGPLEAQLEAVEEEIEIRQRRRDGSRAPIVL